MIVPCAVTSRCVCCVADDPRPAGRRPFREPEVEELRAAFRQHDVLRLEIAMDDVLLMRLVQRVHDLARDLQGVVEWQRSTRESIGERLALEVLEDEIPHAVLFPDVVKRADVRVVQAGDRLRFAVEALLHVGVVGEVRRQHLDGDRSIQPGVGGFVDLAHAASTEGTSDFVRTEARAGGKRHGGRGHHTPSEDLWRPDGSAEHGGCPSTALSFLLPLPTLGTRLPHRRPKCRQRVGPKVALTKIWPLTRPGPLHPRPTPPRSARTQAARVCSRRIGRLGSTAANTARTPAK